MVVVAMSALLGGAMICGLAFSSIGAFFIDTEHPIIFQNEDPSFGHQVVQLDRWVIVSAPLHPGTGKLYRCDPQTARCSPIPTISDVEDESSMSLGLAVAAQSDPPQLIVCGPTLQTTCGHNIYLNGRCHWLDKNLKINVTVPTSLPGCSFGLDIVFLIDGSASVSLSNFDKMLEFVSHVISYFNETDTEFALMQYAWEYQIHFHFRRFSSESDFSLLRNISYQSKPMTRTGFGIQKAIEELFVPRRRSQSQQVLIVITDGESSYKKELESSIADADRHGIRRIAIGVGEDFTGDPYDELKKISSSPDYVFHVSNFSALSQIQSSLQNTIFSIEGIQSKNGTSIQREFSQEGFSVDLTKDGAILGAVGAFGWSGGAYVYRAGQQNGAWINATKDQTDMEDSYLGYSVLHLEEDLIAIGAPRYRYIGKVLIYKRDPETSEWKHKAAVYGEKIGSYFGSVLSAVRVNDSYILLVVGAPTYYSSEGPSGRVYLCPIPTKDVTSLSEDHDSIKCPETLQGDTGQTMDSFGSAISVLPDLSGDQLPDLAVGAPWEDNYQGAVYIFLGQPGGFRPSYIQRVAGSQVSSKIKFFGRSLSGNLDMTGDGLPDLVVGSEGGATVLRSRPVVSLSVSMTFHPQEIPLSSYECSEMSRRGEAAANITICITQEERSAGHTGEISSQVNYTLLLDAAFTVTRAVFSHQPEPRTVDGSMELAKIPRCAHHAIVLPECVVNSLSPLRVFLNFTLIGAPVLRDDWKRSVSEELLFQKNCGGDGVCEDDLKVNVTFSNVTELVVGADLDISLMVSVKNEGDDSYNARILIPFPSGLSYRRVSLIESNRKVMVSCSTLEDQRVLNCAVNRPLLRPNTTVVFMVGFHVSPTAELGDTLTLTAIADSDNREPSNNDVRASCRLRVLYAIFVTITSLEESSKYQNFTSHDSSIQHIYKVMNLGERRLPLSIIFLFPVRLGEMSVWEKTNITSSQPQITKCTTAAQTAPTENYQEILSTSPILNCSVGWCVRVECQIRDLEPQSSIIFTINGCVTKDWSTQTEQRRISLQSWAEIVYDNRTYHQNQHSTQAQAHMVLEILEEYNFIPIIVGSSVGGLVLLALIMAALYKVGFFRRHYKEMVESPEDVNMESEAAKEPGTPMAPEWEESN